MKRIIAVALMTCATLASAQSSPAKKELVAKLLVLQQPGIDNMAKSIAERPVMQLMQHAGSALQTQVPADKREATARTLQADAQKFVEEAYPVIRDRAIKLAPSTVGVVLEEKFNEDELKQLIAWFESPVNKKYQQVGPELQNAMLQKLLAEASPVLDPKLQALQQKMGNTLRAAAGEGGGAKGGKPAASGAKPPAKAASK
jgi:hypothetical protein